MIEADYQIGAVLRNKHTGLLFKLISAFGWQQIEPDGTVTPYEYPLPRQAMDTLIRCECMEEVPIPCQDYPTRTTRTGAEQWIA